MSLSPEKGLSGKLDLRHPEYEDVGSTLKSKPQKYRNVLVGFISIGDMAVFRRRGWSIRFEYDERVFDLPWPKAIVRWRSETGNVHRSFSSLPDSNSLVRGLTEMEDAYANHERQCLRARQNNWANMEGRIDWSLYQREKNE